MVLEQRFETNTIDFLTPKWDFMWSGIKPKLPTEITKELTKNWKYTANRIIEIKSIIGILEQNGTDSTQIINNETQEVANININSLKREYNQRISNLEILAKADESGNESLFAKSILYLNSVYDYQNQSSFTKNSPFISAILGTATMINSTNKDNPNYFERQIIEPKIQSKEDFINDFKNHAKSQITKDEIIILVKIFDLPKPPSLLNNEHKKFIKESLKIAVAYDKTKDYDESLKKAIKCVIEKKDSTPKQEKSKQNHYEREI